MVRLWCLFILGFPLGARAVVESAATVEVRAPRPLGSPTPSELVLQRVYTAPHRSPSRTLRFLEGVHTQETGFGEPQWILRGQDPIQSRFFLEGIPLTTSLYQRAQLSPVPWESVKAIELTSGGIPAALSSGGLGGAVHLRLGAPVPVTGVRAGSGGTVRFHGGWAGPLAGNGEVRAGTGRFPYWDDGGTPLVSSDDSFAVRGNNGFLQFSLLPQWEVATHSRGFALLHYARRRVPGPVSVPRPGQLEEGLALVGGRTRWSRHWESRWHLRGDRSSWLPDASFATSVPGRVQGWGGGHQLHYDGSLLKAGATVRGETFVTDSRRSRAWEFPFYVQANLPGGVRTAVLASYADHRAGNDQQSYFGVSPRLSYQVLVLPQWRARASASYAYRFPSLGERFGAPPFQAPNPALKQEGAWRVEAGVDGRWGRGPWTQGVSLTGFAQWSRDLVALETNAQRETVAVNVGRSRILGVEGTWETRSGPWSAGAGVTGWATVNQTPVVFWQSNRLPHRPLWSANFHLGWQRRSWRLEYRLKWVGGRFQDLANTQWAQGYGDHGLELEWDSPWGNWVLEGRNLADVITVDSQLGAFQSPSFASGLTGYPAPGRQIALSWRKLL